MGEAKRIKDYADGGYLLKYDDGTTERVRFTKTREVHDFDGPSGKISVWQNLNDFWRKNK